LAEATTELINAITSFNQTKVHPRSVPKKDKPLKESKTLRERKVREPKPPKEVKPPKPKKLTKKERAALLLAEE